jgi:hypothetical protein
MAAAVAVVAMVARAAVVLAGVVRAAPVVAVLVAVARAVALVASKPVVTPTRFRSVPIAPRAVVQQRRQRPRPRPAERRGAAAPPFDVQLTGGATATSRAPFAFGT